MCDIEATGMTIMGDKLFVCGGECVEAIEVSDPDHPVSITQYGSSHLFPGREIVLGGKRRYDNEHVFA